MNGDFYGVDQGVYAGTYGIFYQITTKGKLTAHPFDYTDGYEPNLPTQGSDGNFYGTTQYGGGDAACECGVVYKVTAGGKFTVLHVFTGYVSSTAYDGNRPIGVLVQANDGDFYGTTYQGGAYNEGSIFKISASGHYTLVYSFQFASPALLGQLPVAGLTLGTDGNLYGVTSRGGTNNYGTIFQLTPGGDVTFLYNFCSVAGCADGIVPETPLVQHTNGKFYGTASGNSLCCGVFFSFDMGLSPFVTLEATSGKVGTKVGIMGQGFSSSSVVKFGGVKATTFTLTGTTYIVATVPAGAVDGKVTVTTGATTLTSTKTFIVHNSWSSGAVMPTALQFPATGVIGSKVYVVGGVTNTAIVGNNQVYNSATNAWTNAAAMPTPVFGPASAVVGGILYVIGGYDTTSSTATGIVQAYNPTTNTWSTKTAMPTARGSAAAVVDGTAIYVIGGNGTSLRLDTVEKFVPSTDTWTEETPLAVGKSEPSAGLLGTTIVAADGFTTGGNTGDNEAYDTSTNVWSAKASDPTARNASCYGSISGLLYVASGYSGGPSSVTESYSATTNKWTTLTAIPQAVIAPGSAESGGRLYCFGGSNNGVPLAGTVYNYVQIYQP